MYGTQSTAIPAEAEKCTYSHISYSHLDPREAYPKLEELALGLLFSQP